MATIFPGAIWRPIPVAATRPKRRKGRAVIYHVAVSEAASLFGLFSTSGNDSHLYVRKDGTLEQYVDLELVAYASVAANASTISVETQGGVTNPDGEPWTDAQVATLARIARWAHDTEGVPLTLMPNSLPASRGIGYHRLGIDPWRVSGGEVWSSSRGKVCPGAAKIAQVPSIIAAASGTSTGGPLMALTDAEQSEILVGMRMVRDYLGANGGGGTKTQDTLGYAIKDSAARVVDIQTALTTALPVLTAAAKTQDPAALAAALVASLPPDFAKQIVAEMGKQLQAPQ